MKKVIASENIPIKMWLDDIEEEALAQAKNLANLDESIKILLKTLENPALKNILK